MIDAFETFPLRKKIIVIALAGATLAGWLMNLWQIVIGDEAIATIAWRIIGVPLWPLGAVLGWM